MEEWSRRKKIAVILAVLLAFSPLMLLTDAFPSRVQSWIDNNPESEWSPWLQMKLAGLYGFTVRREKKYDCYTRYVELFGPKNKVNYDRETYIQIELDRAIMTGDYFTKTRGMEELYKFIQKYRGTPQAKIAEQERDKLRLR
jgi:hypothetical protein